MKSAVRFDCQIYVPAAGLLQAALPVLSKPRRLARLEPVSFETLVDPSMGRLLVALDNLA